MMKKLIISSIVLSGGLLIAGCQAIGQFKSTAQQLEQGTGQAESDTRQDLRDDQQSGSVSKRDQQRLPGTDKQQFDQQRPPQQQIPLQQQFGVSPRFETQRDLESQPKPTQVHSDDQPGASSDMTREPNPF